MKHHLLGRISHSVAVKQRNPKIKENASRRLKQFILLNTDHKHLPHLCQILRSPLKNELTLGTRYEVVPLIVFAS